MKTITTSPLPLFNSPQIQELCSSNFSDHSSAYNAILEAENYAINQQSQEDIMFARVTGYLLLEFHTQSHIFGHQPCTSLVRRVTSQSSSQNQHDVVFHVGKLCCGNLICLFRRFDAGYFESPSHSKSDPSCSSFNTLEDMTKDSIEAIGVDYQTLGRKALVRDGYQCLVTGILDSESFKRCAEFFAMAKSKGKSWVQIEAAHILNTSTIQCIDPTLPTGEPVNKTQHAADAMAILESFGFSDFSKAFKQSGGFYQVWNLLSLQHNMNDKFGMLDLWFESIDQLGHYEACFIHKPDKRFIHILPEPYDDDAPIIVNFPSYGAEVPPPSPVLLALHATCARVAHMSGAAEFFDQLEWQLVEGDVEDVPDLAFDDSSVHILSDLLSPLNIN